MNTLEDLHEALQHPDQTPQLRPDQLTSIRRQGTQHRRTRRTTLGLASLVVLGGVALGSHSLLDTDSGVREAPGVSASPQSATPTELSPVATRVLAEIPGARQVSAYQVVIPGPSTPSIMEQALGSDAQLPDPPEELFAVDAHAYTGVTSYPRTAFPRWLFRTISQVERAAGDSEGYQVGTFAEGIIVDQGASSLACLTWPGSDTCSVSMVYSKRGEIFSDWGMGTEDFLMPGKPMEIFQTDNFSSGEATSLAIAGIDGTEIVSVDFVTTQGKAVPGEVLSGTLSSGDTIMWADVPGNLARVIAYDAEGDVVDDHQLRACTDPVDCEVR